MDLCNVFSQVRQVRERKKNGDHPVSEMRRFYILLCCFFCSMTVSITYAFDLFADRFSEQFNLSGGDLTTISTVGLIFVYFTIPYSFIYENLGPFLLFWVCCLCALIGGLCLALTLDDKIHGNTALLSVFYAFLNVASGLVDTAYVCVLAELFPRNRGPVLALAKVMTSLGSSIFACIYDNFFGDDMVGFIYFLMVFVIAVDVWAAFTVILPPYYLNWWRRRGKTEEELFELQLTGPYYERKFVPIPRLLIGYIVVIALIIFFAVEAPTVAYSGSVSDGARIALGVVCILLTLTIFLMLLPLSCLGGMGEKAPKDDEAYAIEAEFRDIYARTLDASSPSTEDAPDSLNAIEAEKEYKQVGESNRCEANEPVSTVDRDSDGVESGSPQDPRYQGDMLDYVCNLDFWLIMLAFVCYSATGTLVMYNSSTISIAASGSERSRALAVLYTAMLGVGNSLGRIIFGLFEAYVQHQKPGRRRFIITLALPFSPCLAFLAALFILVLPGKYILFPFLLTYLEEGVFAGVNALIFPCLFQNSHNSLYNASFLVQCICIICYNRLMFGIHIDSQERKFRASGLIPPDVKGCTVPACIRMPMIVATVTAFCGIGVTIAIHMRYRMFVDKVHRLREDAKARRVAYVPEDGSSALSRWIRSKCGSPTKELSG